MSDKILIIYLSDLHFPPNNCSSVDDRSEVFSEDDVSRYHLHNRFLDQYIDKLDVSQFQDIVVIVCGDLVKGAEDRENGFKMCDEFLSNCAERLKIEKTNIIIAPGNHDIYRNVNKSKHWEEFKRYTKDYCTPFSKIKKYCSKVLEIYPLNSTEIVNKSLGGFFKKEEIIDFPKISPDQIRELQKLDSNNTVIRIACCHHHLLPVYGLDSREFDMISNTGDLIQVLHQKHVLFALHGHKHRNSLKMFSDLEVGNSSSQICVIGSKSFSSNGDCFFNEFEIEYTPIPKVYYKRKKIENGQLKDDASTVDLLQYFSEKNDNDTISTHSEVISIGE